MMTWLKFEKIEGNTCNSCGQTGINQWFDQDGMTIYSWQKPKTKPCDRCHSDEYDLWQRGFSVEVNGKSLRK